MGLTEEYREEIEDLETSIEETLVPEKKAFWAKKWLDKLLPIALILLSFVVFIGLGVSVSPTVANIINYLNWAVIAYFAARLVIGFRLAKSNRNFFKTHWMDFVLVVPAFSLLKEVRLFKFLEGTELLSLQSETIAGSALASRNAGVFAQSARIVRIVKRSV
jgi:hypothetical protein